MHKYQDWMTVLSNRQIAKDVYEMKLEGGGRWQDQRTRPVCEY